MLEDSKILDLFHEFYGKNASFREGQLEAIKAVLSGKRTLVVQKTGWGKSLIYFLTTKILRQEGKGLTLIISPLIALMDNQLESTKMFNLQSATINSSTNIDFSEVYNRIDNNQIDILFVAPERLEDEEFRNRVLNKATIGMLVIDEAHCISDWGHDFRPDYRRIKVVLKDLPTTTHLLATTATANDRVIDDIKKQLGDNIFVLRGSLTRESLYIQILDMREEELRLAWLAENIKKLPKAGIIYCLTKRDVYSVTNWLKKNNIDAYAYTSDTNKNIPLKEEITTKFFNNEMDVLVATTAFGMGIDKRDIKFIIHYQRPGNVVSYYQQIGRAGRAIDKAYAILLLGREDDEINQFFINSAFPTYEEMTKVIDLISKSDGLKKTEIEKDINMKQGRLEKILKFLLVNGDINRDTSTKKYYRTAKKWNPDMNYAAQITEIRNREFTRMKEFVNLKNSCYMKFIVNELNDPYAKDCGHCAYCLSKEKLNENLKEEDIKNALVYLKQDFFTIEPRKKYPDNTKILTQLQKGYALSNYGKAGWGKLVSTNKYKDKHFCKELIEESAKFIKEKYKDCKLQCITSVPSLSNLNLVKDFAVELSKKLNLPYIDVIIKIDTGKKQKEMNNSFQQYINACNGFEVNNKVKYKNVLLVDDMVDSRWTLTVCGIKLMEKGAVNVYPFALANTMGDKIEE